MAYTTHSRSTTHFAAQNFDFLANMKQKWIDHRAFKRTVRELSKLGRAELADLGMSESSIHSVAYEAVYGPRR